MVKLKTRSVANSKQFAQTLVSNRYNIRDEEILKTNLVYSSDWSNPNLHRVDNYHFKIYYLINQIEREMKKIGIKMSKSKIKEDTLKKEIVMYQKMVLDPKTGKLVDYFFIIDTRIFKAMVFRRETDFSVEQNRVYRAIKYLHDELFLDFEQIYGVIARNGFNVNLETVSHIVSEL